jgi:Tn3 transposase DDE domain-containing protein
MEKLGEVATLTGDLKEATSRFEETRSVAAGFGGESWHELARRLFFANQGAFRTGDYEEIMNKVSALAVLSNAVLVWNTVRMTEFDRGGDRRDRCTARSLAVAAIVGDLELGRGSLVESSRRGHRLSVPSGWPRRCLPPSPFHVLLRRSDRLP